MNAYAAANKLAQIRQNLRLCQRLPQPEITEIECSHLLDSGPPVGNKIARHPSMENDNRKTSEAIPSPLKKAIETSFVSAKRIHTPRGEQRRLPDAGFVVARVVGITQPRQANPYQRGYKRGER